MERDSIRKVLQWLLLGTLLAAQTLSFAHEINHLSNGDSELCEICRVQGNSTAITAPQHEVFPDVDEFGFTPQFQSSLEEAYRLPGFHPRGPPIFLR